ncbi:bifunctional biotin--[acetyl-CoA-carboxylase] ligase/biotin operon repressor BirA [Pseudomonadota bacterium]
MKKKLQLLRILSDNRFHSGERIGEAMGISRTAVWKHIQALQTMGVDCYSVSGKGYRLSQPIELLDKAEIELSLSRDGRSLLSQLELHPQIHSTNSHLMENRRLLQKGHACLAELQTNGRGRRGRQWVSPFARNLYLSLYWYFDISPAMISGLGLAVGVGIVRALNEMGLDDVNLKWPNDILWQGQKLAGILLEMSAESGGPYHVVIGVGMNINMDAATDGIDQPWVGLSTIANRYLSRNAVASAVLDSLLKTASEFQTHGLAAFIDEWHAADAYAAQPVVIQQAGANVSGIARGIDNDGAIIIETSDGLKRFHSGDVSLRPAGGCL